MPRRWRYERRVPERIAAPFREFERFLGGRPGLADLLRGATLAEPDWFWVGTIVDPDNDRLSLARLCVDRGVSLVTLLRLCAEVRAQKGAHG
jgi:hypothetical protein